ncbi:MAG: hypothetical protein Q4F78_04480 [Bacillota bacterium]|nr:hypothetical protein [Bacillota bacterium]
MRKKSKWLIALMALIMALSMTACGGEEEPAAPSGDCFADQYVALIESGEARDFADYDAMAAKLAGIAEETGALYVYTLTPGTDGVPALDGESGEDGSYLITVDGCDDPDDWATDYGWEVQFTEAWEGTPASARSAWNEEEDFQCWSAFAPVYDSEGNVVCILGMDYPCTDVIADYPEWNRDNEAWNGYEDEINEEVPADIQAVRDNVTDLVAKYAAMLSHRDVEITTDFGNQYVALLESGKAREYTDYDFMKATLDAVREESGATYVYVMTPGTDGKPDINGDYTEEGTFLITVDGSEDPDDWGVDYGWEVQFTEAWEGEAAAARSAWINDEAGNNHDICWSVFAPIYDGEGNVVAILGIDYPCADVLNDYPEWNRDMEEWNGYEDEIDEEVPADIQAIKDKILAMAADYAQKLSQAE